MGKLSNEQIWNFAREFAKKLYDIDKYWLNKEKIRTRDIAISMYYLSCLAEAESEGNKEYCVGGSEFQDGIYESEDKLEDIIPKVAEDETIEAVFFCEGDLWEKLYYCEANGSHDENTKAIYEAFLQTAQKYGLCYEWGSGVIFLYERF